ncbi:fungal-specific transcription factor domain-containing protein [Chaetomium sp. MPI-SDFR-AT-0129]|nr:fungal-specific transcription factor domain-containing protein [Chaetomium sp. MPI-SDFR-AT-0129]
MASHETVPVPLAGQDGATALAGPSQPSPPSAARRKARRGVDSANQKRRCVSTACIACRKRKSKCDGALPSCAACASVYGTECVYDPNSDHRRKGVYREKTDSLKARDSTLQILIEAILNAAEEDVPAIVKRIRTCDSLDEVAESILKNEIEGEDMGGDTRSMDEDDAAERPIEGEKELARKMGELRLENGSVRYIGGTSHLIYLGDETDDTEQPASDAYLTGEDPRTTWTEVTKDTQLVTHLMNMYFNWHYPYFTTLSKSLFYRDYLRGKPSGQPRTTVYCTPLLVNVMLALGCHFTAVSGAFGVPGDSRTKGDHFFAEAKRLIIENDEYAKPRLATVQALALMSVREAGCGREANGWVYSGMSFRMAQDIGLNLNLGGLARDKGGSLDEEEVDARRVTFWGCFLFDKCWSNYLGRLPQIPKNTYNVPKYDVFPDEDAEMWSPYTDSGFDRSFKQPSRTRAAALHLSTLCEISSDLLLFFYHPNHIGRSGGKNVEVKKLSELHRRLEEWKKELPSEFEARDGQLPHVILMHMFFHMQYIHLFKAFLKYSPATSPLPAHVSPWRICGANAGAISKLMRLYKKLYDLGQICNIAVYMVQTACTIHILHLPEKTAKRDMIHGVKHLEEIAEFWPCARRALSTLSVLARKWKVELPEEASVVLQRTDEKYGTFSISDVPSPNRSGPSVAQTPQSNGGSLPVSPNQNETDRFASQTQYGIPAVQPPTSFDSAPPRSLPAEMIGGVGASGLPSTMQNTHRYAQGETQAPRPMAQQSRTTSSMPMGEPLPAIGSWTNAPGTRTMPNYTQALPPVHAQTTIASPPQPLSSTRGNGDGGHHASPHAVYAVDGQEWYLKDGVNWEQNFQAWGPSGGGSGGGPPQNTNRAGGGAMDDTSMFVFQGVDMDGMDTTFDSLGMGSLDHLPGLD